MNNIETIDPIPSEFSGRAVFSLGETAGMMNTSISTLRRCIAKPNQVKTIRVGERRIGIPRSEVLRLLTEGLGVSDEA